MFDRFPALAACGFVLLLGSCTGSAPPDTACRDCNVVIISVDTLRADHVGACGYGRPTTPNIDALTRRGVLFENAIAQSSWTRSAHMLIFTGLHPREHGYIALGDSRRLEDSVPTLATVLHDRGYTTAAFVGGVNLSANAGFDRGFDVYRSNGRYFRDNMEDVRYWLDHDARPKFFLFFHGYDAHTPYRNDPVDRVALALPDAPPQASHAGTCRGGGPLSRIDPFVDEYDAAVHRADRYVGKLVAELETRGLLERTILVVLSDHGEEFLEHGRCFHVATLYREVVHVPVVILAPALVARRVPHVVSASVTIAPTVMELLGIGDHPFPGPSLAAAAAGGDAPADPVVSETERSTDRRGDGHVRALTTQHDKLIDWTTSDRQGLFDADRDPAEQNAIGSSPRQQVLAAELAQWAAAHPPRFASRRRKEVPPAAAAGTGQGPRDEPPGAEKLRSLGYAE